MFLLPCHFIIEQTSGPLVLGPWDQTATPLPSSSHVTDWLTQAQAQQPSYCSTGHILWHEHFISLSSHSQLPLPPSDQSVGKRSTGTDMESQCDVVLCSLSRQTSCASQSGSSESSPLLAVCLLIYITVCVPRSPRLCHLSNIKHFCHQAECVQPRQRQLGTSNII